MSLFNNWDIENLASIYFRDDIPSSKQCCYYFELSENAIIKSHFNPMIKTGTLYDNSNIVISEKNQKQINESKKVYQKFSVKRNYLMLWIRELLWFTGKWRSKELDEFLDMYKPEIIIFGMEGYRYFNRVNRYIIRRTGARAIGFFWDDNFTYLQRKKTPGFLINRYLQRKSLKKTASLCDAFFAISPKTKKEADNFFGINCEIITKPVDCESLGSCEIETNDPISVVYTGNLKIGRLDALRVISDVLINNPELEKKFEFKIYSSTVIPENTINHFSKSIHFCGSVPAYEVSYIQEKANVLLLLEDITGDNQKIARLSFSTKITDYLAKGKCIIAVANETVASTEYLKQNNCALCVSTSDEIKACFRSLLEDKDLMKRMGTAALSVAKKNHSREVIENRLYEVLERL
ncbi:MAG: hypothetical protein ACLT3N_04750 [[Ruminococcus] torques]|uniref:hypothetical protein n=1 Tax=[Ruminococcus] torques TaxID=33039 RepID=UPI0039943E3B